MPDEEKISYRDADDADGGPETAGGVPIVGLGASAGGIEALIQFFDATPAETGVAFVVVLHLDPTRESQLSSILGLHTSMPVVEIEDGTDVVPNHVYVIAPNNDLTLDGDKLRLTEPSQPRGHHHPVDVLFNSLADQRRERAVAIVLSGTGTNGTQGLREIKATGGLILVQDPATARFDGMPRSAIGARLADHVLAPGDMPGTLLRYFQHGYVVDPDALATVPADKQPGLAQVLDMLRARSGQEFRSYKPATLLRRINRRMSLKSLPELGDYIGLLRAEPSEVQVLVRDLLINVTSFFRDAEAWATLGEAVITQLVADRETGSSMRVWVPACASGEEAYSVAMLLIERAEAAHKQFDLKIFATDVLEDNLSTARAGVYPGASVEMLPPERIRGFFERLDGSYQIRKTLRDLVVFARHDLLRDPPFSRMDLITCRNMLIYIEPEYQRRALALFHFALREGGRLFLGSAETIGRADDLFETVSKKWRIYRRIGPTRHDIVDFPIHGGHLAGAHRVDALPSQAPLARVTETARRVLLDRYVPASVLVDHKGRVLYFHGETADYLKQPTGEPTRDLLAMAREGLLAKLRGAMGAAIAGNQDTSFSAQIRQNHVLCPVRVRLSPLPASQQASGLLLVTFEPESSESLPSLPEHEEGEGDDSSALESELRSARSELQGTIEKLESVNEELKASNEESTSINEELQSTNEELETSKEELQSFNEELHTVNNQLQHKIRELEEVGDDLANLLSGTGIATLFLDTRFVVKWFSPAMEQLLNLMASDIGRPIGHFARKFADAKLLSDADAVLAKLTPIEAEVQSDDARWFLRRVLPYRTRDNRIAGLVITFFDISERRRANNASNEARIYAEAIVSTVRQPLVILDSDLRVRSANPAFYALFETTPDRTETRRLYELGQGEWNNPELRQLFEEVLPADQQFQNVEIAFGPLGSSQRWLLLDARRLVRDGGREDLILLTMEDITERKRGASHQEMLIGELNHRVKNVLATVQAVMIQTLRQSASLEEFKPAFVGRLLALAQAHNLLADKEWVGTDVGQLVFQTLAPYRSADAARIRADGPNLTLRPQAGVALVMVLHELATNAAKYGSLSGLTGTLTVTWHREGEGIAERIHLRWTETGGPKVTPPLRRGFGTKLIERSTTHDLGGEARVQYLEEGLRCELIFPRAGALPEPAGVT